MFLITAFLCVALFVSEACISFRKKTFLEYIVMNLTPNGFFKLVLKSHIWMLKKAQVGPGSNVFFF